MRWLFPEGMRAETHRRGVHFRMEFGSEFGTFAADLVELRGRGSDLEFTE